MSSLKSLNSQRLATLVCGVVGALLALAPWYTVPAGFTLGVQTLGGVVALLACGGAIFLALFKDQKRELTKPHDPPLRGAVLAAGLLAAAAPFLMTGRPSETDLVALLAYEDKVVSMFWYASVTLGVCIALTSTLEIPGVSLKNLMKMLKRSPKAGAAAAEEDEEEEEKPQKKDPNRPRRVYTPKRK